MEKKRFCSKCGSELDVRKICTGCGKKYFSIKRMISISKVSIALNIILIISLFIGGIFFYKNYLELYECKTQLNTLTTQYEELNSSYELLQNKSNAELKSANETAEMYREMVTEERTENNRLERILNEYYGNFAFFTPAGEKYHKLTCPHLSDSDVIYVDCIGDIEKSGYSACYDCY